MSYMSHTGQDPMRRARERAGGLGAVLALAVMPLFSGSIGTDRASGDPDPCALVTQAEAAAAMGVPSKPAERGKLLKNCTYRADVPPNDPRHFDMVLITIQDEALYQVPKHSKAFGTEPVSVGDEAYYSWSGRIEISGITLYLKKHGAVVLVDLNVPHGGGKDPNGLTIAQVKERELTLAKQVVSRLP